LVKIADARQADNDITSQDIEIVSIQSLLAELNGQIDQITQRVDALSQAARDAVATKHKASALRYLRSRKLHEDLLSRRSATLTQVEDAYKMIEEAANNLEVVKAMQATTSVLRKITAESGSIEDVESLMESLNEEMTKVEEVGRVIREPGQSGYVVDEDKIDDELNALEQDARAEEAEANLHELQQKT